MARVHRGAIVLATSLLWSAIVAAQDESVARIRAKIESWRPAEEDLALFRLDWADSVSEAMRRAGQEKRPVFCIANYAEFADLKNGHC